MAATEEVLSGWFDKGLAGGYEKRPGEVTHMIVVVDQYDWEDYPVYVYSDENVHEVASKYDGKNMQRVVEVYSFSISKDVQMNERRAFHWE